MTQAYRTAAAFKQALEQQLRTASASGVDFARRRQLEGFEYPRAADGLRVPSPLPSSRAHHDLETKGMSHLRDGRVARISVPR